MKPRKIAISQLIDNKRVLLSMALSIVSNFQLIQNRTQYEWQRQFNINDSLLKNWYNQSLIISASFINRVESETGLAEFISNGASFSEVLMLKATNKGKKILNKQEEVGILKSLLNVTGRYACKHYDLIIHIRGEEPTYFDDLSIRFYEKHQISYNIYDDGDVHQTLKKILHDTEIPVSQLSDNALYCAEKLVHFKNWKS